MVSLTMVVTSRMLPKNAMDLCIMVIRPPLVGAYYIYICLARVAGRGVILVW